MYEFSILKVIDAVEIGSTDNPEINRKIVRNELEGELISISITYSKYNTIHRELLEYCSDLLDRISDIIITILCKNNNTMFKVLDDKYIDKIDYICESIIGPINNSYIKELIFLNDKDRIQYALDIKCELLYDILDSMVLNSEPTIPDRFNRPMNNDYDEAFDDLMTALKEPCLNHSSILFTHRQTYLHESIISFIYHYEEDDKLEVLRRLVTIGYNAKSYQEAIVKLNEIYLEKTTFKLFSLIAIYTIMSRMEGGITAKQLNDELYKHGVDFIVENPSKESLNILDTLIEICKEYYDRGICEVYSGVIGNILCVYKSIEEDIAGDYQPNIDTVKSDIYYSLDLYHYTKILKYKKENSILF